MYKLLTKLMKFLLIASIACIALGLMLRSVLGYGIASALSGLGIGGIAIAVLVFLLRLIVGFFTDTDD